VPRALRRIVGQCLKPRAARRIASATAIRCRLEALLDRPSTVDLRRTLSSWLWERHVFETRDNETVVLIAAASTGGRGSRGRLALAMAAVVAAGMLLGYSLQHPSRIADWSAETVARLRTVD